MNALDNWEEAYKRLFEANEEHTKRYEWDESVIKMLLRQIKIMGENAWKSGDEIERLSDILHDRWTPIFPSCELDDDALCDECDRDDPDI